MKKQPSPLTEAEIARIRRVYVEVRNCPQAAKICGVSLDRVQRHTADLRTGVWAKRIVADSAVHGEDDGNDARAAKISTAEWRKSRFVEGAQPRAAR